MGTIEAMICKDCGSEKIRIRSEYRIASSSYRYRDENGKSWNGRQCPGCHVRRLSSKFGIDNMQHGTNARAREAEHIAANYFRSVGWGVVVGPGTGPDLHLFSSVGSLTCEVKMLGRHKGFPGVVLRSCEVTKKRRSDDLICFVRNGRVHSVEEMTNHLGVAYRDGSRIFRSDNGCH